MAGDKTDEKEIIKLNNPEGKISEKSAKITPFKLMKGKQPFDPVNKYLIVPKLFGPDGYWKDFNWEKAAELKSFQ